VGIDVNGIKEGQKQMWASGDYPEIARTIEEVAEVVVERVHVAPGKELLDVATGSGNVAISAARKGAAVTGLDITPELLQAARRRASEACVEVHWIEGDAEELPFADAAFDRVTSCFGVMFAPRQGRAAAELVRVARPGARIAFTAWTPEGLLGKMFKLVGSYMPPPPPELTPPVMWGTEDHVRSLFAAAGVEPSFERRTVTFSHDSPESWVEYNSRVLGPSILARAALEPQGRWDALQADLVELYRAGNEATDGTLRAPAEYLLTVVELPA
jgi:ubiquinone/menaquinone biosynthesis C-methylase UbiE